MIAETELFGMGLKGISGMRHLRACRPQEAAFSAISPTSEDNLQAIVEGWTTGVLGIVS